MSAKKPHMREQPCWLGHETLGEHGRMRQEELRDYLTYECLSCRKQARVYTPQHRLVVVCPTCGVRSTVARVPRRVWDFDANGYVDGEPHWVVLVGGGRGEGHEVNAQDIYLALKTRHPEPDWVYLPQVRTKTGYSGTNGRDMDSQRYLDAFAMHCHPSKDFQRVAYEIKVARSDWLQEIADPRKRAQGYFLSHEFWYAVAPGVVKLPEDLYGDGDERQVKSYRRMRLEGNRLDGCGILQVNADGTISELVRAAHRQPYPMPEAFVASLMRSYLTAKLVDPERHVPATAREGTPEAEVLALLTLPFGAGAAKERAG